MTKLSTNRGLSTKHGVLHFHAYILLSLLICLFLIHFPLMFLHQIIKRLNFENMSHFMGICNFQLETNENYKEII